MCHLKFQVKVIEYKIKLDLQPHRRHHCPFAAITKQKTNIVKINNFIF